MFRTVFLFSGPISLAEILFNVFRLDWGRLMGNQMLFLNLSVLFLISICYWLTCWISYKFPSMNATRGKAITSLSIFLACIVALVALFFLSAVHPLYNERVFTAFLTLPLVMSSLTYLIYSLIQKLSGMGTKRNA